MLIGSCLNDFASLYPYTPGVTPNHTAVQELTDEVFQCRARIASQARRDLNITVWRYLYFGEFPNLNPLSWLGAYHAADIPMVFGTSDLAGPNTQNETALSVYMQNAWATFARDPEFGLSGSGWPVYEQDEETLVLLGVNGTTSAEFSGVEPYDQGCGPNVG